MLRPRYSEPHYSLYSSDTEEQIASVHRGLNKCTSLLKNLMTPGDKKATKKKEVKRRKQVASKCSKNDVVRPLYDAAPAHQSNHNPVAAGGGGDGGGGGGGKAGGIKDQVPPSTRGHKRSVTEPGTSSLHRDKVRQLSSTPVPAHPEAKPGTQSTTGRGNVAFKDQQVHPPINWYATKEQENVIPGHLSTALKHQDTSATSKRVHMPPPPQPYPQLDPPPQPPPPPQSYPWPFCHIFPYNFSNPLSMQPLLAPMGPYMGTLPPPNVHTCSGGGGLMHYYMPGAPPPPLIGSSWLHQNGGQPAAAAPGGGGVHGNTLTTVRCVLQEMLHSLEGCIANIKATSGCADPELSRQLEVAGAMQHAYVEQVEVLCADLCTQQMAGGGGGGQAAFGAEWLLKQEEQEGEMTRLHERLLKSETAYSEAKRQLEGTKLKTSQLLKDLEWQKSQCSALKLELLQKTEAFKRLGTKNEALEMELAKAQMAHELHCTTEAETAALRNQVNSLEAVRNDLSLCKDELVRTRNLLEAAQEDVQLTRMSLSEKSTELLEAQDRLLEIRQCLAYFLSELKPINGSQDSAAYSVCPEAVQRFRSLVDSGNIAGFTAFYRARSGSEQCGDSPVRGDSPVGGDSASSSHSTLMSPSCQLPLVQGRRPCAKDGRLGTKACSAGVRTMAASSLLTSTTTSTEQEFRRDLATLDADIARLHIQFKVAQQST